MEILEVSLHSTPSSARYVCMIHGVQKTLGTETLFYLRMASFCMYWSNHDGKSPFDQIPTHQVLLGAGRGTAKKKLEGGGVLGKIGDYGVDWLGCKLVSLIFKRLEG
ncbi:hypothetical protein RYX36_032448 [Vicia faba]